MRDFSARLTARCKALDPDRKWTPYLAKHVGVKRQTAHQWLNGGIQFLRPQHLVALAELLADSKEEAPAMLWWLVIGSVPKWMKEKGGPPEPNEDPEARSLREAISAIPRQDREHLEGLAHRLAQCTTERWNGIERRGVRLHRN